MKKSVTIVLVLNIILLMSGCVYSNNYDENGNAMDKEQVNESIGEIITHIKDEINVVDPKQKNSNFIETTIDLNLTAENTEIYYLTLANDSEITMRYTYSTEDKDGAVLGYLNADSAPASIKLLPATKEAYQSIWQEEKITLRKGENTFYLTGNGVHCKMILQIDDLGKDNIIDSGTMKV